MAFIFAPYIYLVGNLRDALGPYAYSLADFIYGPVWAASLVTSIFTLRERIGKQAPLCMSFALLASVLAAGTMVVVACIRASNRHYHLIHPELHLESSLTVLTVWATIVQGVIAAGWHFMGWALLLVGSAGWTTRSLPLGLSCVCLVGGIVCLFVFLFPNIEPAAAGLGVVWAVWQGIFLWKVKPSDNPAPEQTASQPG